MIATYATAQQFKNLKQIGQLDPSVTIPDESERTLAEYLIRATDFIEGFTHRRFFPSRETHMFSVPLRYQDLRNRSFPFEDLILDDDLLEPFYVQTSSGEIIASNENVPVGGLALMDTSFTADDPTDTDASGNTRFASGDILRIDNEFLRIQYVDGTTVHVQRGFAQTVAAAHTAGTAINKKVLTTLAPGIEYYLLDWDVYPRFGLRIVWPNSWSHGLYTASVLQNRYPQVFVDAFLGYHDHYDRNAWVNTGQTVLNTGGISTSDTSIEVTSITSTNFVKIPDFEVGNIIRVDNELMLITALDAGPPITLTVERAQRGTFAEAHDETTIIYRFNVQPEIVEACVVVAKTWREADASVGGRQGVSDMSAGVELSLPKDTAQTLTRYRRPHIAS